MISILIAVVIAVIICIVLFIALDYFAAAVGGDARLWLLMKGLIVLIALFLVLQRTGVVA